MVFNYLKEIRKLYETSSLLFNIIFILGNNTCDMDSALSSYLLSIGKNIKNGVITLSKKGKPSINAETKILYLPVLNIKRGTLHHRIDVKYVFDNFGIDENDFWYISDDIFNPHNLFQHNSKNNIKTNIIIVDHAILIEEQKYLSDFVIGIYDHHLLSNYKGQYKNLKTCNIMYPIGSCTTLILSEYFDDEDFPVKIVSPILALTALLMDTSKFNTFLYGNRWVDLDRKIYKKIKKIIKNDNSIKIKMKKYYKEIKAIKHDIKKNLDLGFEAIITMDQKVFNWNNKKALWSTLPIPFEIIKNKFGDKQILDYFFNYYNGKSNDESKNTFFIFKSSLRNKQKEFTIYNPIRMPFNKTEIQNELIKQIGKDFYSVDINNIFDENKNPKGEVCHITLSNIYSRKLFEPILNSFFSNLHP